MIHIPPLGYGFLFLENEESPKHIGSVEIMSPPESATADYVSQFVDKLRQRQPGPPFCYKLKKMIPNPFAILPAMPSGDVPIPQWRIASSIDMERHVVYHQLPQPGSLEQLTEMLRELHLPLLERDRPLWECHVIEGYNGGARFVVYTKIHFAIIDGMEVTTLIAANTSADPDPEDGKAFWESPDGWSAPEQSENSLENANRREAFKTLERFKTLATSLINFNTLTWEMCLSVLQSGVGVLLNGLKSKATRPFSAAPTRFDRNPDAGRSLVFGKLPMDQVKTLSKAAGVTINELLLAIFDMAVSRYLTAAGEKPKKRLVAMMPMALRTEGVNSLEANAIAVLPVKLGRTDDTPLARLRAIVKETAAQKDSLGRSGDRALAASMVMFGLAHVGESLKLTGKVAPLGNFIFSTVPGPLEIRYRFDAKIEEIYPISGLVAGAALNISVYSYGGQVLFQLMALEKAAPDLCDLMEYTKDALQEVEHAVHKAAAKVDGLAQFKTEVSMESPASTA
jgi:WS/DGAT/MGAT family acyltransferase